MPTPQPEDTGPRPNPFIDFSPFGTIEIGGVEVPGVLQSIGGISVKQDWNFQKASGGGKGAAATPAAPPQTGNIRVATPPPPAATGASTAGSFGVSVWRGAMLAEEIEIETWLTTPEEYDAALDFMLVLMPKRGQKVPSLTLMHPDANLVGITRCAIRELAAPAPAKSGHRVFKFKLCEYKPQATAPAGAADPAKPPGTPAPKDAAEKELDELMKKAAQP